MTTIVRNTNVPENINTLERLLFHNVLALQATIGSSTFNLNPTDSLPTPYIAINKGVSSGDKKMYAQVVMYIPLDEQIDSNALNQRPWMYAQEISNNTYPVAYNAS